MDFDLESPELKLDIPSLTTPPVQDSLASSALLDELPELSDSPTIAPSSAPALSFSLQDLEVSITPREIAGGSKDEELNTKLDLARAYVEMGDNDMARSLLQEVQQQGGERQQQEAQSLLQRLPT
jgi:FimV-like protein